VVRGRLAGVAAELEQRVDLGVEACAVPRPDDTLKQLGIAPHLAAEIGQAVQAGATLALQGAAFDEQAQIVRALGQALGGAVSMPFALSAAGSIIRVFHPRLHSIGVARPEDAESRDISRSRDSHARWATVARPVVRLACGIQTTTCSRRMTTRRGSTFRRVSWTARRHGQRHESGRTWRACEALADPGPRSCRRPRVAERRAHRGTVAGSDAALRRGRGSNAVATEGCRVLRPRRRGTTQRDDASVLDDPRRGQQARASPGIYATARPTKARRSRSTSRYCSARSTLPPERANAAGRTDIMRTISTSCRDGSEAPANREAAASRGARVVLGAAGFERVRALTQHHLVIVCDTGPRTAPSPLVKEIQLQERSEREDLVARQHPLWVWFALVQLEHWDHP
jgi:hypothetical protein